MSGPGEKEEERRVRVASIRGRGKSGQTLEFDLEPREDFNNFCFSQQKKIFAKEDVVGESSPSRPIKVARTSVRHKRARVFVRLDSAA